VLESYAIHPVPEHEEQSTICVGVGDGVTDGGVEVGVWVGVWVGVGVNTSIQPPQAISSTVVKLRFVSETLPTIAH
jgi:hypothetical protein